MFALSQQRESSSMVKSAFDKVKVAYDQSPNDPNVKNFYEEVKQKYDKLVFEDTKKESDGPKQPAEETKQTTKEKLLSRVKIEDDEKTLKTEDKLPPLGQTLPEEETKERPKP